METWGVLFLGVIALGSVVQTAGLIVAVMHGRRLAMRLDELQLRLERQVQPALDDLKRTTRNLGEVSDLAVAQVRRIDEAVNVTVARIEDTVADVRRLVLRPLGPVGEFLAVLKGIRRGIEVYQRLSGEDGGRRGDSRRYKDDEHLFI